MMKWILAALAFFGFHRGATAPPTNSGNNSPKTPTTAPTPAPTPTPQDCATDGQPYPPIGCH